jgi:hypothetical protein
MAKSTRQWIELEYVASGSLRAEDIPYDASIDTKTKIDQISASLITFSASVSASLGNVGSNRETITFANSFSATQPIYRTVGGYALSDASDTTTAEVLGIVEDATSTKFTVVYSGKANIPSHGLGANGEVLFVSTTAGALTITAPTTVGDVSKPVGIILDSDNILVQTYRGLEIGAGSVSGSGGGGGGSGETLKNTITFANSFSPLDAIRRTAGGWVESDSGSAATADVAGLVESANGSEFTIVYGGEMTATSHGFTIGSPLFLGKNGLISHADAETVNTVSKPVGIPIDANTILVQTYRGVEVGSGSKNKVAIVNEAETGLEFVATSSFGGGGSSTFTGLTDTPSSYTGEGSKFVVVSPLENGLVFVGSGSVKPVIVEEVQSLSSTQTAVTMSTVTTQSLTVYVEGVRLLNSEYTLDAVDKITLGQSYPSGSKLALTENKIVIA